MTTPVWRLFCAVELPQEVRAQLRDHISTLRKAVPDVAASWSRVENIHLTLKFFGNVAVDRIPAISAASIERSKTLHRWKSALATQGVPAESCPGALDRGQRSFRKTVKVAQTDSRANVQAEGFRERRPSLPTALNYRAHQKTRRSKTPRRCSPGDEF
jgi:hypothetical protein